MKIKVYVELLICMVLSSCVLEVVWYTESGGLYRVTGGNQRERDNIYCILISTGTCQGEIFYILVNLFAFPQPMYKFYRKLMCKKSPLSSETVS